jgi:hypothetical protein
LRANSLLDHVQIASPCRAEWDEMVGGDRVRFCGQCAKAVHNLSALSREEAEALLREAQAVEAARTGSMCVRLYRRTDGTVLTADCPDGVRRKRRRLAVFGAVGGGLMAAGAVTELFGAARMGVVARPMTTFVPPGRSETAVEPPPRAPEPAPIGPEAPTPQGTWHMGTLPLARPTMGKVRVR